MQRSLRRAPLLSSIVLVTSLGCGGASEHAKAPAPAASSDSVGAEAVAQGGIEGLGGTAAPGATALSSALHADQIETPVKMDGVPREWPARTKASETIEAASGGDTVSAAFGVQYDDDKLYFAGEITDPHFHAGKSHASLVLAIPGAGGALVPYEIGFYPGKPGESAGAVRMKSGPHSGKEIDGSRIIEAPSTSGVTFEAVVPLAAFPETHTVRVGLRAAARYYVGDKGILATGQGDVKNPTALPSLPTESEQSLLERLLTPQGLADKAPRFDVYADVTGDAQKERLAVYGRFFTIVGGSYRKGTEFFYKDLGGEALSLETRALTGRGKDDVLLRRRVTLPSGSRREWFEVWVMDGDEPVTAFAHEIAVERAGKRIANDIHVAQKEIEVSAGTVTGWDAASYKEPPSGDVDPIVLPWGAVLREEYRFDASTPRGGRFVKSREVPKKGDSTEASASSQGAAPTVKPSEPPTPPVSTAPGDLGKRLFEQYKREHGVAASAQPKTDLSVDVAEDTRPERVVLIGRDLVVFGPGYRNGSSYAFITLSQFESDGDVEDLTARDLTGDGKADLVVRGVRHVTSQDPSSKGPPLQIDIEALFVYEVKSDKVARLFAVETGRSDKTKHAQGLVQFVPSHGKGFEIDVRPGKVTGWTEKTYPWGQDQPGSGALEPLLLPWGGIPSLRYAYDGTAFTLKK